MSPHLIATPSLQVTIQLSSWGSCITPTCSFIYSFFSFKWDLLHENSSWGCKSGRACVWMMLKASLSLPLMLLYILKSWESGASGHCRLGYFILSLKTFLHLIKTKHGVTHRMVEIKVFIDESHMSGLELNTARLVTHSWISWAISAWRSCWGLVVGWRQLFKPSDNLTFRKV